MKYVLLAPALLLMVAFSQSPRPENENELILNYSSPVLPFTASPKSKLAKNFISSHKNLVKIPITSVHIRAFKEFSHLHNDASKAEWFKTDFGFVATLIEDGKNAKIVYDKEGRWFYNLYSYSEDLLPKDVRHLVNSRYYDNDMLFIYQYDFDKKSTYIIRMTDSQSKILTLLVCDGMVEEVSRR